MLFAAIIAFAGNEPQPPDYVVLGSGWSEFQGEEYEKAAAFFTKAVELKPDCDRRQ